MQQYVYSNRLEKKVFFLGVINRKDISLFWKRQDICINCSDYEARCISKLEAMANGVVPIVTETAGMKEDIKTILIEVLESIVLHIYNLKNGISDHIEVINNHNYLLNKNAYAVINDKKVLVKVLNILENIGTLKST